MRILLVGGGSGGPVAPLLAVAEEIQELHPKAQFLFVGGKMGPERLMAEKAGIPFASIPAGKWRRYFSGHNFFTPLLVGAGFIKSLKILRHFKPACVFGVGSFVQVPLCWAAWLLGIPVVLHQQDLQPSLANTLCQITAKKITVTFEDSLTDFASGLGLFYKKRKTDKIILTGNPFRRKLKFADREKACKYFGLKPDLPTLFAVGGGTGALSLNRIIKDSLPQLVKTVQIIHATGQGKLSGKAQENYHPFEFIAEIGLAYAAADIVLCRAGLSTITELSNLEKVSIIVPMPGSHQEINAMLLADHRAAVVVNQNHLTPEILIRLIRKLLFEPGIQKELKENVSKIMPKDAGPKIAKIILEAAKI
jgi:UDP-N-acetylglucosamine--N-acetylmuramyl-(pentapeptide) pyrophosphoryl-undecaprenol N-acetylglucosamine transferase